MADDRLIQRLEEQLRDSHATNADLRERLGDVEERERQAHVLALRGRDSLAQAEQLYAKLKAAEDNAKAERRKRDDVEREAVRARGQLEEARRDLKLVRADRGELHERIEKAKSALG